jgi:SAM-dependent methyltransferase
VTDPIARWSKVYDEQPDLYDRLIRGESLHPQVLEALPRVERCVEIGAGTGRLTMHLAQTCDRVLAIEPAEGMRAILEQRVPSNVDVRDGTFAATGLRDGCADLVVSCSAFTPDERQGGEAGLAEMLRIAAPGATVAIVWPLEPGWLEERGFSYRSFDGDMTIDFGTLEDALELARVFYPEAVDAIAERGSAQVPFEVIGMNAPRDICWRIV